MPYDSAESSARDLAEKIELVSAKLKRAADEIGRIVIGQPDVINQTILTLLSGGHALYEGVPGLAKTLLAENVAKVFGIEHKVQPFTPDLLPLDMIGSEVLEEDKHGKKQFRFIKGPVFTNVLLADEINRAGPRVQSGLLRAMQEKMISFRGENYPLPKPFHVLATQNPLDQEGTFPLPEAQLDRFLFKIHVDYPDYESEKQIYLQTTKSLTQTYNAQQVFTSGELLEAQALVRRIGVGDKFLETLAHLVRSTRPGPEALPEVNKYVQPMGGAGIRAGQAFMLAARARAVIEGRLSPSVEDLKAVAKPILSHRLILNHTAKRDGMTTHKMVDLLTNTL